MMPVKKWLALAAALMVIAYALIPKAGFTEDEETLRLARVIYALAREESYETKLAIGTLAMNRVNSPWFGNTLGDVLAEQHQFPSGNRYDDRSLAAAHDVLSGRRVLDAACVYYQPKTVSIRRSDTPVQTVGSYAFYATDIVL